MNRLESRNTLLNTAGWSDAQAKLLAGDASSRRYERLARADGQRAVLMDAPPERGEDCKPFLRIGAHLLSLGLSAPHVLASDPDAGFLLLEDLGDDLFARLIEQDAERETALYEAAVDVLLELHGHPPLEGLPPLGHREMAAAVDLALDWYAHLPASEAVQQELQVRVFDALEALPLARPVLALRDYHAENLIWLPDRQGAARVGLLDFQDAFAGHPAYDLVSLLEDARRDVAEPARTAAMKRYSEGSGQDRDLVELACATFGAQRNLRILGVFARLCMHFGKAQYVDLIPRVWGHLQRDLSHPALSELSRFVNDTLPEPETALLLSIKEKCGTCPRP